MRDSFKNVSAQNENKNWANMISRKQKIYTRANDVRSDFERDYTRILHCNAYRRLKHKTQVFFSPKSDHVCTRIEHVNYVESISNTIAGYLGLNTQLTKAIAIAHDIGHSPFGHKGEKVLNEISKRDIGQGFWHEKNGVHFVDDIELLEDDKGDLRNLNLTYAVRDGIISHCGEIDENSIKPRSEFIDLSDYSYPNEYNPYTWEGCVVKVADKISYIGRDLEDAIHLNLLGSQEISALKAILNISDEKALNNPNLINEFIIDICNNSSVEKGICFSKEKLDLINRIKEFNYKNIYAHPRLDASNEYFSVIINRIYNTIKKCYGDGNVYGELSKIEKFYPYTIETFKEWLQKYSNLTNRAETNYRNNVVYNLEDIKDYYRAIIDFIAGMTDNYAIDVYNEILKF